VDRLVADLIRASAGVERGSDAWLGFMYLAALWATEPGVIDTFLAALRDRQHFDGLDTAPSYSFESIGEVIFLRRRAPLLAGSGMCPRSKILS
jgi:hypothetical protein